MTGNFTLGFTGAVDGHKFIVELIQDGVGGRTLAYNASGVFGADLTSTTLSTSPDKIDRIGFIYNNTVGKYAVVAYAKGF